MPLPLIGVDFPNKAELSVVEKDVALSRMLSSTRKMTPGGACSSPSQTTPLRTLGTRMKAQNSSNNKKKITKMTAKEREEMKIETKDIRNFFNNTQQRRR